MTGNPFLIRGPAVISFSGGRTSGFMLFKILEACGGTLPEDVVVTFSNTGREMPQTLDFVRDCGAAWDVHVHWLEYRWAPGGPSYVEVNHNSASRAGEPFAMAIKAKSYLPNPMARFCTGELKVRTAQRFIRSTRGWKRWTSAVGLRADEPGRVAKLQNPAQERHDDIVCPLAEAGIEEYHVLQFWREQPFNLRLRGRHEGNCDGCFLKGRGAISRMFRDYPERMAWWVEQERDIRHREGQGATFRIDREDYAEIARTTRDQGVLPFDLEDAVPCTDAVCGV